MQVENKLFAEIFNSALNVTLPPVAIADEQDALEKCASLSNAYREAAGFKTFEVPTVAIDGKSFAAAPENISGRRFIAYNEDCLRTRAQFIQAAQEQLQKYIDESHDFIASARSTLESRKQMQEGTYFLLRQSGNFELLGKNDMVYGTDGKQLYPPAPRSIQVPRLKFKS